MKTTQRVLDFADDFTEDPVAQAVSLRSLPAERRILIMTKVQADEARTLWTETRFGLILRGDLAQQRKLTACVTEVAE